MGSSSHLVQGFGSVAVAGALVVLLNRSQWREYRWALVATAIHVPGLAGFVSVILYLASKSDTFSWWLNEDGVSAYTAGSVIALLLWLVLAGLGHDAARARTAHAAEYRRLWELFKTLRARFGALEPSEVPPGAVAEASANLDALAPVLEDGGEVGWLWVSGAGYVDVRERLHRVEEALIRLDDLPTVLSGARYDEARVDGSNIAQNKLLLDRSEAARQTLTDSKAAAREAAAARGELAQIRRTINEYRDSRRAGLVRAKTNLVATSIYAALNGYALLGVAMIWGARRPQILAAAVFYLAGATVGLFRELQAASTADVVLEEDYGLGRIRLYQTPLFSGLAAVGGVVLTSIALAVTPNPETSAAPTSTATTAAVPAPAAKGATPGASPASTATKSPPSRAESRPVPRLTEIFDLHLNPLGVVFAAIFGLTPTLLIARLRATAEKYKLDLKSTEAGEHPPAH